MRLSVIEESGTITDKVFDPNNFQPSFLFDVPIQLHSVDIDKVINDETSYIVTLYTKTFQIHTDKTIKIKNINVNLMKI